MDDPAIFLFLLFMFLSYTLFFTLHILPLILFINTPYSASNSVLSIT